MCCGAGKTTFTSSYCKDFKKLFPTSPIYLFSCKSLKDERVLDNIKRIRQVEMTEDHLQPLIDSGAYDNVKKIIYST